MNYISFCIGITLIIRQLYMLWYYRKGVPFPDFSNIHAPTNLDGWKVATEKFHKENPSNIFDRLFSALTILYFVYGLFSPEKTYFIYLLSVFFGSSCVCTVLTFQKPDLKKLSAISRFSTAFSICTLLIILTHI